jgi:hypothetical protein
LPTPVGPVIRVARAFLIQSGALKATKSPVHPSGGLAIEQQAEPGGMVQLGGRGIGDQLGEGGGGALQTEFGQAVVGGMMQHE